jgi:histone-lysine N-methyltransferase SETMAR
MKVGFTVMIQKQSNNQRSGRAHNQQEQKRRGRSGVQQGACSLFFDVKGIVHCEFVPPNTTINSDFYRDVLRRLRENVRRKRPELWHNHNWLLHRDNTPAHTSLKTTEFVTNNNMIIVPCSPYSPDLAPCDFTLFPRLKMNLEG